MYLADSSLFADELVVLSNVCFICSLYFQGPDIN